MFCWLPEYNLHSGLCSVCSFTVSRSCQQKTIKNAATSRNFLMASFVFTMSNSCQQKTIKNKAAWRNFPVASVMSLLQIITLQLQENDQVLVVFIIAFHSESNPPASSALGCTVMTSSPIRNCYKLQHLQWSHGRDTKAKILTHKHH